MRMNHFFGLPWRIASLAGLLVGGISLLTGAGAWTCLLRVAVAFAVFGAAGFALKIVLQTDSAPVQGKHFDRKTPDDSVDESTSSSTGDTHS